MNYLHVLKNILGLRSVIVPIEVSAQVLFSQNWSPFSFVPLFVLPLPVCSWPSFSSPELNIQLSLERMWNFIIEAYVFIWGWCPWWWEAEGDKIILDHTAAFREIWFNFYINMLVWPAKVIFLPYYQRILADNFNLQIHS